MDHRLLTRRQCAQNLLALSASSFGLAARQARELTLRNAALDFRLQLVNGKVTARTFTNRLTDETAALPNDDFALEFDHGPLVKPALLTASLAKRTATGLDLLFGGNGELDGLQVRVQYELPPGRAYLRKQIMARQAYGRQRRLLRADLDNWQGVKRNWDSMHADRLPYASHPVYCENLWAGVEFVAAFNEYSHDGFVLRSRPGGTPVGAEWLPLRSTVVGVAGGRAGAGLRPDWPQAVRDAFLNYLEDVRLAPPRFVACYNSWWTLPLLIGQSEHLALARELAAKLQGDHGVFFDVFATDEGWTDPQSVWKVNRQRLPDGFADLRAIVEGAGGKLGLWMSPSGTYPRSVDYAWMRKNGYVVVEPSKADRRRGVSLACPKYREAAKEQLKALIRENHFEHIKYDGFIAEEEVAHDGLSPGRDSVELLAEYSLELIRSSKEANPQLVAEPTYLNSLANYISPWMIKYSDTVWGNSGGDCPLGIGPAPDYRESHTNAREYYIFSSLREFWLPQNAVQYFDIVHCDAGQGFANHAAMAFGRGRFFIPTYVNPKFMTPDDWRIYAGLLRWARKNTAILRNTIVLPSRVEAGEPYIYAHWLGRRGILAVRNPSNESKNFVVELDKTGAPEDLSSAVCYTQYPYRKGIEAGLSGSSAINLTLAPWELLFLEIAARAELREPVAIGSRWQRNSTGGMELLPDAGVGEVRILQPTEHDQMIVVQAEAATQPGGKIVFQTVSRLPENEWLATREKAYPTVSFDVECAVSLLHGKGKVLLLLQFPGREQQHRPSDCQATVNSVPVPIAESSSGGHIGYHGPNSGVWQGIQPYESQWTWYLCEVGNGASKVRFRGAAGHPQCRIGVWLWLESQLSPMATPSAILCPEPVMPQYRPSIARQGVCLRAPVAEE